MFYASPREDLFCKIHATNGWSKINWSTVLRYECPTVQDNENSLPGTQRAPGNWMEGGNRLAEFLAQKHQSMILGPSSNPVCGSSMMLQVRLCDVWPMENWFGSSLNQTYGWTTVLLSCFRAWISALISAEICISLFKYSAVPEKFCECVVRVRQTELFQTFYLRLWMRRSRNCRPENLLYSSGQTK